MSFKNLLFKSIILISLLINKIAIADNHNIYETLELIQKDIKTLEKAVYSGSADLKNVSQSSLNLENNSE